VRPVTTGTHLPVTALPALSSRPTRNSPVLRAGLTVQASVWVEPLGRRVPAAGLVMRIGVTVKAALVALAAQAPLPTSGR
jgi:hypothetical protein